MYTFKAVWVALAIVAGAMALYGCGDGGEKGTGPGPEPADLDSSYQQLTDLMEIMIDSMSVDGDARPGDFDFTDLHRDFEAYLTRHPGDPGASFGAAITSLMTLTTSEDLNALIDSFVVAADEGSFFQLRVANPGKLSGRGSFFAFPTELSSAGVEKNFLAQAYVSLLPRMISNPPKFSELQTIIREEFIPAVQEASDYIGAILEQPNFIFWVTPEMMGETSDSVEIDRADFLTFAAGLHVIQSFLHLAVAYNVDLPSYDSAGLAYMFDQSNGWMSLHPDGDEHMTAVLNEFMTAVAMVDGAITALQAEQIADVDQSNDLIKATWTQDEYNMAHTVVDTIEAYATGPQWVKGDFDDDPYEDSVRINVSRIFTNPINGIFTLLPSYASEVSLGYDSIWYYSEYWNGYEWVMDSFLNSIEKYCQVTITWDADAFEQWLIPNPTLNGLIPDITTDLKFKELFGLSPDMWQKQMEMYFHFDDIYLK